MKSIFIHIPKTGGISVQQCLLKNVAYYDHATARYVIDQIGREEWDKHFTFTFVRNPWDKLVSWFYYRKGLKRTNASKFPKFDDWIEEFVTLPNEIHNNHHYVINGNQLHFLEDEDGKLVVDFIGKFESLHEDFGKVCSKLGLNLELPHWNKSKHEHYSKYYNKRTKKLIGKHFARDIDFFNYKFEAQ